ncbi:MAG: questin oxidase family protein [Deltaproteobacteria bacterium]
MVPDFLVALIREHRDHHHLYYPPSGYADHGPMAYLALHALGASPEAIARFAVSYREKLAPLPPVLESLTVDDWYRERGNGDRYAALVAFFDAAIAGRGWRSVLGQYLPKLISGVVRGAFHPLIRLAYGIEFELPSEIAAGLAFMACTGQDDRLARASEREPIGVDAPGYLKSWHAQHDSAFAEGGFDTRYERVLDAVCLRPLASSSGIGCSAISRSCLEVFHATHDFFALHLVTGSHAFRICSPWAGPHPERLLSVAIAAAYLVVGAPDFEPIQARRAELPTRQLRSATDEHDIKLAYSCRQQARAYADAAYEWVAAQYLMPRLDSSAAAV